MRVLYQAWRQYGAEFNRTTLRKARGKTVSPAIAQQLAEYRIMRYPSMMRLISNKPLRDFAKIRPVAEAPLQGWRRIIERGQFRNFAELKRAFNSADKVGNYFVFNIAGNNYRLIAAIHFNTQILYVRSVMTHAEYDEWRP